MPVIGTPVVQVPSITGQPSCSVQLAVAPKVTQVAGRPVLAKMQAVQIVQGQLATIQWIMKDINGNAVDLTACTPPVSAGTIQLKIMEVLSQDSNFNTPAVLAGSVVNVATGQVQATLPATQFALPGISIAEFGLYDPSGNLLFSNTFYLIVNRSMNGPNVTMNGPPTIPEIRLFLRDSDPNGNLWLGDFEFDAAEIAACITRPIFEFNEAPPPIDPQYTTASFPWRHNWLNAICGYLYRMAADWYRRVDLTYQAGGLSIQDKAKYQQYDARGQELLEDWRKWMLFKKVQLNADAAYQTQGSSYSNMGFY